MLKYAVMKTKKTVTTLQPLFKLGLSHDEVACYIELVHRGSLRASELAQAVNIFPNAVYRIIDRLKQKGFVVVLDTHPVTFQAIPPQVAINAFVQRQAQALEEVKTLSIQAFARKIPSPPETRIDMISGRRAMFKAYVDFLKQTKEEVLIISVGESVPDELKLANRDALERGVSIKFIPHRYDEGNAQLLRSWVRMGIEVRHFPDSGFHLVVFDKKHAILVANNPDNIVERTSLVIYSGGLSQALRDYFYATWENAAMIDS